ncbi:GNAT family N-acetyltransferase [Arthrobacter sp. UM1]|uniref:GNAT family N-acetyltransferase n=1 Tax=Arthrobacter sp. UM1 TaxID=2766776 RepID=UPI001CF6D57C|nr:GNAT family N-acetyltransferase [Arthrobacter sp. UM1]MCB4208049.1 N-acetyltransferase [Arthrobacter sp. UM1]
MAFSVRPWREGDDLALLELWNDAENAQAAVDRALLQGDSDSPFARGVVALDDGVPAAAGSLAASRMHPERVWIHVETAPAVRGQGLASQIADRLRDELADAADRGLVPSASMKARYAVEPGPIARDVAVQAGDAELSAALNPAAARLAARLGLEPVQESRSVVVRPGAVPVPDFQDHAAGSRHVTDLATGSVELTLAVKAFYEAAHAEWDPAEATPGGIAQMLLSPQSGAHGALVVRSGPPLPEDAPAGAKAGKIRAFAVSYASAQNPEDAENSGADADAADVLIGWDPELSEDEQVRAVADLLGLMVAERPIRVEADRSMTPLLRVLAALEADGTAVTTHETRILATPAARDSAAKGGAE